MALFFSKLRVRLLLLISLILLPALMLATYTASEHRRQAGIEAQKNALLLAELASSNQQQLIDGARQLLIALTQLPVLRDGNQEACTTLFVNLREQFTLYTNFYMVDINGETICTGLPDAPPVNVKGRQWFERGMAVAGFSMSDFEFGMVTRRPIVTLSYPIFDADGGIKYQLGLGLDLRRVEQFLSNSLLPPETAITAVDRNGTILYRYPDMGSEWIGQNQSANPMIRYVLTNRQGTVESAGLDEIDRLYGFTALDVNNYSAFVIVGIPTSVVYSASNRLLVENLFALGVIGSLAFAAAWVGTSTFVVNPIHRLIRGAERLEQGNLDERIPLTRTERTEELDELTLAFNRMAQSLQQRQDELTQSNYELNEARESLEVKVRARTSELAILVEAQKRAEDRAIFLRDLAVAISEAVTPQQVANIIAKQGLLAANGQRVLVVQLTDDGQNIEFLNDNSLAFDKNSRLMPLHMAVPLTDVVKTGQSIWIETPDEYSRLYPMIGEAIENPTGSQATVILPLTVNDRPIGAMEISFAEPRRFSEEERNFLHTLARQCAQALERARLYEAEKYARLVAENARQRLTFLAQASTLLTSSLDYQVTLDRLVQLAVPRLAEWCHVDVLHENGVILRAAATHLDSRKTSLLYEMNRDYPAKLDSARGAGRVIRTGESELATELPQVDMSAYAQSPRHLELLNEFATRSYIIVPLTARGRTFGAITFANSDAVEHFFDEADLSLVEELAQRAALAIDNARLYQLEQRLHESTQLALSRAEEADRLKLKFLAMISHELRTPLTSIKGFATTLLAQDVEWDDESRNSFIRIISEEADKLTDLIEQLLDLSRLQAGTLRIAPEIRSLNLVFEIAMAQLRVLTEKHRLEIAIPEVLPLVSIDVQRIAQVIVNLVGNAARYSPPMTCIRVAAYQRGDIIQIDVEDEGPGIPPEKHELVFEAFRQADDKSRKGAGLGLAICRGMVEAHHGKIWIQSKSIPGTTISFTLPVVEP